MRMTHRWPRLVPALALAIVVALPNPARAQPAAARGVEPVVVKGAKLPSWSRLASTITCMPYPSGALIGDRDAHNGIATVPPDGRTGVDVNQIAAYRWDGPGWTEIPVQVDQMYFYCLSNPHSDFGIYSGTDKELTYAWDVEAWKKVAGDCSTEYLSGDGPTPDPVATLDDDDEIVFMASDAGQQAPIGAPMPPGTTDGQALAVVDPLDPSTRRFVYLFLQPGGSSFNVANGYVHYTRDANADEWIDKCSFRDDDPEKLGTSNTGYGPNLSGNVCRTANDPGRCPAIPDHTSRPSTDRFPRDGVSVTSDAYSWHASGRWMIRSMSVAKPAQPGNYGPDLIDRWKGRAFQQNPDSTISLVGFEDEQVNWEANSALLGERAGPVRAIREIWGADSGTNVTNTESFYRDEITYHYHVRVHPIPPDGLYTSWDYNAHVVSKYYDIIKPDGVDIDGVNDDTGNVDGVFGMPAYFDAPDPTFNAPSAVLNWEEVSGAGDNGSLVYIVEIKGATTAENPAVVPYYRDDACLDDGTGDNPVPRPWPGETSTDPRVQAGYSAENGGTPYAQLTCEQKQGVWGAHGIHYFFSNDTDNAASPEVLTEIDAQQWQFTVPTAAPTNVGQQYGNVVITPLQTAAVQFLPLANPLPPGAADGSATTDQAVAVDTTLSGADVDNCELTFSIVDPPTHGTLGPIANQTCSLGLPSSDTATVPYTPVASFFGTDTFTYKVNDGATDSNPATVSVRVKPQNPPLCATGPEAGCRRPVRSGRAALLLRDRTPDRSDKLIWKWITGAATSKADFGSPLTSTSYTLCVYDANGNTIGSAGAPVAASCRGHSCWRDTGNGFSYRSRGGSVRLSLHAGGDGTASIIARGRGVGLDLDPLPASQPLTVQMRNGSTVCWEALYSAPARHNQPGLFTDRGD